MHVKSAQTRQPIHELMRDRWSSRAFSSEPISESEIIAVLEAGRWAPSSYNEQPWRFLVGLRPDELWHKIFDALDAFNQAWCSRAPALIVLCAKKHFSHNGVENFHAVYDCGQAAMSMALQAQALGLITHQMAGFSWRKIKESFDLSDEFHPTAVIALGGRGSDDYLSEDLRANETKPRSRRSLAELVLASKLSL